MKKIALGLGVLAVVFGTGITFLDTALAYRGDPAVRGPNYSTERHEAMEQAFDNSDYVAWTKLMQGRGRVTKVVNENNFARFAEAHSLTEQGKYAEANKIRQELGLGVCDESGQGMRGARRWNR